MIAHGSGVRTRYAHLSRIAVKLGESVGDGLDDRLRRLVGQATGPHLHFEVTVRGANVDPLSAL